MNEGSSSPASSSVRHSRARGECGGDYKVKPGFDPPEAARAGASRLRHLRRRAPFGEVAPAELESGEVLAKPVRVVGAALLLPRHREQRAAGLGERARLAAHPQHLLELNAIERVERAGLLAEVRLDQAARTSVAAAQSGDLLLHLVEGDAP